MFRRHIGSLAVYVSTDYEYHWHKLQSFKQSKMALIHEFGEIWGAESTNSIATIPVYQSGSSGKEKEEDLR
jgi:hypothetical protein